MTLPARSSQRLSAPRGVVFDLDGTLVDTVRARIDGWLAALDAAQLPSTREQLAPMIGMDGRALARRVAEAAGDALADDRAEAIDRAAGGGFDQRNRAPRALPGVGEMTAALRARAIPWAIATSSRREQVGASVAALRLPEPPTIVDGSEVRHAKPEPDLLLLAAERLGVEPRECWAVGDSTWDMRAAVAAGMPAVGVTAGSAVSGDDLRAAGAVLVVATLEELARRLSGPRERR
jgi:beta-phosphoglucomutase-like phosphatase (HAD superfamily)